jgi:hypothetical protein
MERDVPEEDGIIEPVRNRDRAPERKEDPTDS